MPNPAVLIVVVIALALGAYIMSKKDNFVLYQVPYVYPMAGTLMADRSSASASCTPEGCTTIYY